jgi:hypothetical protein
MKKKLRTILPFLMITILFSQCNDELCMCPSNKPYTEGGLTISSQCYTTMNECLQYHNVCRKCI